MSQYSFELVLYVLWIFPIAVFWCLQAGLVMMTDGKNKNNKKKKKQQKVCLKFFSYFSFAAESVVMLQETLDKTKVY